MRLAILCNSTLGLPSFQWLAASGRVVAGAIPEPGHEATDMVQAIAADAAIPLRSFSRQGFVGECCTWLDSIAADAVLTYTFPFKVPTAALDRPRHGFLNFHFAPLPGYRGAEPVFWLLRGRVRHGAVTVHRMTAEVDRGPIILERPVPIAEGDTHGAHMARLASTATDVTANLVELLRRPGALAGTAQDESCARTWPRPGPPDVSVHWSSMVADDVLALVRACNPWNKGAYTFLHGTPLRITLASASDRMGGGPPGTLRSDESGTVWDVACAGGTWIRLDVVLLETGFSRAGDLAVHGLRSGMQFEYPFQP